MNNFREDDILILIGAGCSKEAEIPTSIDMVKEIEKKISNEWKDYKELYHFLKSSILYADGLQGKYGEELNIERLVNTLSELEKKEEHPIYPFISGWNSKIIELCGHNFGKIREFKSKIIEQLKEWITLDDYSKASYYQKIIDFELSLGYPLRVFSLNYDLCLEKNFKKELHLERGFNASRNWEWQKFEKNDNILVNIYLYKMHGSIDWEIKNEFLTFSDEISKIQEPSLIFGTNYKLQYVDPYLFFAYELRKYSLEAKLIITIGYGYGDEHINSIIAQAIRRKKEDNLKAKLIINIFEKNKEDPELEKNIREKLKIENNSLMVIKNMEASKFLESELNIEKLSENFPIRNGSD